MTYRSDVALQGVSLKVDNGEFVGILGPNGAGKTTLLKTLNGTVHLLSGEVCILDQCLSSGNIYTIRKKIGYVSQIQNMDPRFPLSVREAVMMGRYGILGFFKMPNKNDWGVVDRVMELVGLKHLRQRPIGHLSGGEQQRVAIARCLAQEPEIFLLDEPTASLDLKARTEILQLVTLLHHSQHLTTLFVTHDLNAIPASCSRIVLMKQGIIWGQGLPEAALTDFNLSQVYDMPIGEIACRRKEKTVAN